MIMYKILAHWNTPEGIESEIVCENSDKKIIEATLKCFLEMQRRNPVKWFGDKFEMIEEIKS